MTAVDVQDVSIAQIQIVSNVRDSAPNSGPGDDDLTASIASKGILEPLIVTKDYRLVAGHRRLAAAKKAGLKSVPARIMDLVAGDIVEVQLTENLQREDLTPLEEARAFKAYLESMKKTQAELGAKIGKSQPYVANRLRLLDLPDKGKELLQDGKITTEVAQQILRVPVAAKGARNAVLRKIDEELQYRGAVGAKNISWSVSRAIEGYHSSQRRQKVQQSLKFPTCPVKACGKNGSLKEFGWNPKSRELTCGAGHSWSGTTGKVSRRDGYGCRTERAAAPTEPTLPLVDPTIKEHPGIPALSRRLLEAVTSYEHVELSWKGKGAAEIRLDVRVADLPVPGFRTDMWRAKGWLSIDGIEDYNQRTDSGRKDAAQRRAAVEAWLATFGKRGRRKA